MKKIVNFSYNYIYILDPKDYLKIEEDNQHLDDKYVDVLGKKFNKYRILWNGEIIVRNLYHVGMILEEGYYEVYFTKFKHYGLYYGDESNKINENLNTKNSVFVDNNFDQVKNGIVKIFSSEMEIKIK